MSKVLLVGFMAMVACGPSGRATPDGGGVNNRPDASGGGGGGGGDGECAADGVDLIYVLDEAFRVLSFDPKKLMQNQDPFALIGSLNCPTQLGPTGGALSVTPMSMSVDRQGVAWIHYTSGEVFKAPINDIGNCTASGYQALQQGFDLFGMGFAANSDGSDDETLFIAHGDDFGNGTLGAINPSNASLAVIGDMTLSQGVGPELSGTGAGELFAFEPGLFEGTIRKVNKASAAYEGATMTLPRGAGLASNIAYAFAQWGGRFYVFYTTDNDRRIHEIVKDTGVHNVVMNNMPYTIVGAGVSTCAPVILE